MMAMGSAAVSPRSAARAALPACATRASTLHSALSHLRNRLVSSASNSAISTTPRPVRSLILPLLIPASEVPRVRAGRHQDGDIRDEQEACAAAEAAPIAATTFQQAVNPAIGSHTGTSDPPD